MKDDERKLLDELKRRTQDGRVISVRALADELGINVNRAAYICGKWTRKGW